MTTKQSDVKDSTKSHKLKNRATGITKGSIYFIMKTCPYYLLFCGGEYNITGFRNKDIRARLPAFNTSKISRLIKRLNVFGLIKRAGKIYKYYLTKLGKELVITAQKLKETILIPALNY